MPLATIAQAKAWKPVTSAEEARLTVCLDAASAFIEKAVGRPLASASYTRRLSGDGSPLLLLPHWPITAVTTLEVEGIAWEVLTDSGTDTAQSAYLPTHGLWLEARDDVWPEGSGNIKVVYTAGYTTIPMDLVQACIMIAFLLFIEEGRIGDGALTLGPQNLQSVVRNPADYELIKNTLFYHGRRL